MPKTMNRPLFHPDFAGPADWALMYRACGLQVVPGHIPSESPLSWKRPAIAEWKTFQDELAPDSVFQRWYGPAGEHSRRQNMGLITGRASQNVIVIDLDTHTKPEAALWWDGILAVHNFGIVPETWEQVTGGGGRQIFFRAPDGWHAPTNKTSIGVDIRGQGGFAVLPPSIHSSGREYAWAQGYEPWTIEIADAPDWLLQEILDLVERHGGHQPGERAERTASPDGNFNAFGRRVDGREDYMTRLIWGVMVDWWRDCPIHPTEIDSNARRDEAWTLYERNVKPRITGPGTTAEKLEREGRGPSAFAEKWARAYAQWDQKVAEEGRKERPGGERKKSGQEESEPGAEPPPHGQIKTVDFTTLLTEDVVEEPDYIVPDFAGPGNFVLIAGPPKAQKSFLCQEMLVACATGGQFLAGQFAVPRPLRVFYLQAEMNRKLLRKRARAFSLLSAEERQLLSTNLIMSERFHMILNDDGVKTAVETIRRAFPGDPPDILAFDPMANLFDAENESDNAQVMRFLTGRLEAVRQKVNPLACIVLIHHAAKKSSEDLARDPFVAIRGAGALRGYYDSAIVIFRPSEEGQSRRVHFELRGGESPEPMTIELVGGRFQPAEEGGTISMQVARQILEAIRAAWKRNEPWSNYPRSKAEGRYAPHNASTMFGVKGRDVQFLIDQWLVNGVVTHRPVVSRKRPAGLEVTGSIG